MFADSTRTAAKVAAIMATAIVALGGSAVVGAQDDAQNQTNERLLACAGKSDPTEKMACFDAVVENLKQSPAAPAAESPTAVAPDSIAPAVIAPAAAAAAVATPATPSEPEPAAKLQSSTPTDTPVAPTATSDTVADDFGLEKKNVKTAEQKEKEKKEEFRSFQATIVRSWRIVDERVADDRFAVQLDNGQVWQATEMHRVGLPKVGISVEVSKGRFGGYRMKIDGIKKLARVRRTK